MKIIINDDYYVDCAKGNYTLVNLTGKEDSTGKALTTNVGYYASLESALKRAFYLTGLKKRTIPINSLDKYLKEQIDIFIKGLTKEEEDLYGGF